MSTMLPPKPTMANAGTKIGPKKTTVKQEPDFSADDLLEPGVDINLATYFVSGWTDAAGEVEGAFLSLYAAGVARAWTRLGLSADAAFDAVASLEALFGAEFDPKKTKWTDALPQTVREGLLERQAPEGEPSAVTDLLKAIAPTMKRWADGRALARHLARVGEYMLLDARLAAATVLPREDRALSDEEENVRHVLIDDPVMRLFNEKR